MPVQYEDLSPKVRQRIAERVGAPRQRQGRKGRGGTAAPTSPSGARTYHWRCASCTELFKYEAAAMRHGNQDGHHRIEFVL